MKKSKSKKLSTTFVSMYDPLDQYKIGETFLETMIDNCPIEDYIFDKFLKVHNLNEDKAMELMIKCEQGNFSRSENGWQYEPNEY